MVTRRATSGIASTPKIEQTLRFASPPQAGLSDSLSNFRADYLAPFSKSVCANVHDTQTLLVARTSSRLVMPDNTFSMPS